MRIRIGYGGPRKYRHGQYFPGGRRNNGNMTEIERLIHLIASMQILFGSRRGGAIVLLLVIAAVVGGWYLYRTQYSPEKALENAHAMWESNDTKQQIAAIKIMPGNGFSKPGTKGSVTSVFKKATRN